MSADPFLATAARIGARLCQDAIWDGPRCTWLDRTMGATPGLSAVAAVAMGPSVYDGTSGVALFLSALYRATGEAALRAAAAAAARHGLALAEAGPAPEGHGYYSGTTGIASTAIHVGALLDEPALVDGGRQLLADLAQGDITTAVDVVDGSAGVILAALRLPVEHGDAALALAERHGGRLLQMGVRRGEEWYWNDPTAPADGGRLGAGFAHGLAGIGLALLELGVATKNDDYRAAGAGALRAEAAAFDRRQKNWAIVPAGPRGSHRLAFDVSWCRGAIGIGLARLRAYEVTGDRAWLPDAQAALEVTVAMVQASPLGSRQRDLNLSLCHGMAGGAELLLLAARLFEVGEHRRLAHGVATRGLRWAQGGAGPWPGGLRDGGESVGLMLGLAGIGLFYLRQHDPALAPPLLLPWAPI
jgi:lantibiotic modifying enzyme